VRKFQPDAKVYRAGSYVRWEHNSEAYSATRAGAEAWLAVLRRGFDVEPSGTKIRVTVYRGEYGRIDEQQGAATFGGIYPYGWHVTRLEAAQEYVKREKADLQAQQKRLDQARELLRAEEAGQR
jgi:hypothetical protein